MNLVRRIEVFYDRPLVSLTLTTVEVSLVCEFAICVRAAALGGIAKVHCDAKRDLFLF